MSHLSLSLLGPFQVTLDGQAVSAFESNRVRALLAYLAVEAGRPHPREVLAGLFWPNWPQSSALANLRRALTNLRTSIGDTQPPIQSGASPFLLITRETIEFNVESDHDLDVRTFGELVRGQSSTERLERAVALYRGSVLEGLSVADSSAFEEWATLRREELAQAMLTALERLAACHEQRGEYPQAESYTRRQLAMDPLREGAHRQLMRVLALDGRSDTALAQYRACRRLLAKELGVEPAPETTALYERIREGTLVGTRAVEPLLQPAPAFPAVEEPPEAARPLFVAREQELAKLNGWLESALSGQGRVGFVVGEPGSGKTMLMQEFARRAMKSHGELLVASGSCNAYSGLGDPYLPFLEILQMLTGDVVSRMTGGGISREHGRRLWGALPTAVQALVQAGPELIDLLVPGEALLARAQAFAPTGAPWPPNAPIGGWRTRLEEMLRRKAASPRRASLHQVDLFEQVTHVLQALAREHPLLLVLDDLQWADAGSISLLFHLGRRLAGSRILVLGAYRPEEVALGRGGEQHPLEPVLNEFRAAFGESLVDLAQAEGRRFVEALIDSQPNGLGAAFRETFYRHTGGQALFTVELWRGLQERGDLLHDEAGRWVEGPSLDWERLPTRVEAVIAQHIARLPREWQELLTVASVEGEEFTAEVLARVQGEEEGAVIRTLSGALSREHRLVQALSLRRLGEQRLSGYRFRHYLFQSYLYRRLDEVQRVRLHEVVGNTLEVLYGARPRSAVEDYLQDAAGTGETLIAGQRAEARAVAPQLARHFQSAGLTAKAVAYLQQAGDRAVSFGACQEGVAYLNRALELLSTMPDTPERDRAEYWVQDSLSDALGGTRGLAAPEKGQALARLYELAQRLGEPGLLLSPLYNLHWFHLNRADHRLARHFAQRCLELVERERPKLLPNAHYALAASLLVSGDFPAARQRLESFLAPNAPPFGDGLDPVARIHLAFALWYLGYPDQALQLSQRDLSLAYKTEDAGAIAYALSDSKATHHQLRREPQATLEGAEQLLALTGEDKWPWLWAQGVILAGWAQAHEGRVAEGLAEMRQGLAKWRAIGMGCRVPHWSALLAEGYAVAGQAEEGLGVIAEALEFVERTDERYYEAELHRLKGELLRMQGADPEEVEESYRQAVAVAQRQQAKSWELRATVSLARLWQSQGKREEAREMLAAIYGWFTEGFDTPDLREAKALLEELSVQDNSPLWPKGRSAL